MGKEAIIRQLEQQAIFLKEKLATALHTDFPGDGIKIWVDAQLPPLENLLFAQ